MSQAAAFLAFYPPPDITPSEFEEFVAGQLLGSAGPEVSNLHISLHEKITGTDGTYDFDATVRYQFAELSFLVLVEAKLHKNPIKRELVQVLYQKVQSAGAHKGVRYRLRPIRLEQYDSRKCMALRLLQSQRADFYMRQEMLCQPLSCHVQKLQRVWVTRLL